ASSNTDKRASFVDSIFDASLFPLHTQLKRVVTKASITEWETTSIETMQILAQMDISFPQPFQITKASLSSELPGSINRLYVDSKGLTSNIDQVNILRVKPIDTYHIVIPGRCS
ncbi:hypothetical protein K435DRAFT_654735, partial [Dendrothele bispora CBS 962.96]